VRVRVRVTMTPLAFRISPLRKLELTTVRSAFKSDWRARCKECGTRPEHSSKDNRQRIEAPVDNAMPPAKGATPKSRWDSRSAPSS
jgi:hypothetical protein